jgi:putative DNA methylase
VTYPVKAPKKLIEVALPLDAINVEAAREKSIRHGHPSTLHLWWARRPLAAARAVIFAQLVNDPSWKWEMENRGKVPPNHLKGSWAASRKRLFEIITELVKWENTTNEEVLERARAEIRRSWREVCELNKDHPEAATLFDPDNMPGLHDPFAGGGTIPLEAQRLGLEAYASDLNPVAVLINKAMIEIPPKFAGRPPVNPESRHGLGTKTWKGAQGLAEDVRYYGKWMREEAWKRIGHLYPPVKVTRAMAEGRPDLEPYVGKELTVVAWLWARTVKSPSPAFSHVDVPLVTSFVLSVKEGREVWVEPVVHGSQYHFVVHLGATPLNASDGTKADGRGANFRCVLSGAVISNDYIKTEGKAGRIGQRLITVVAEGPKGRVYLSSSDELENIAKGVVPDWKPDVEFFEHALGFRVGNYGMKQWSDLFTARQLTALTTFCDQVSLARERVLSDSHESSFREDERSLESGGNGRISYADSLAVYLACAVDSVVDDMSTIVTWRSSHGTGATRSTFARQALSMTWDFAEANAFSGAGDLSSSIEAVANYLEVWNGAANGQAYQADATSQIRSEGVFVSTDPPYYDNIGYADLSEFFYVWLRRSLRSVFPRLFGALVVPKADELVATPARHGGRERAEKFFLNGMSRAVRRLALAVHPAAPISIYYAFKQSDTKKSEDGTSSTGWETFLESVVGAGLTLTGTWPARTERPGRTRDLESNALASSIVLVCRRRPDDAPTASRREFLRELNAVLPEALDEMTRGAGDDRSPVAPVDLSQAIIGPGMAVFSKYRAVLEADGTPMTVQTALRLINRFLVEDDFDLDTQFCLRWFEQHFWADGQFGEADVLARAKGTSVAGLVGAGVVRSEGGKVRLLRPAEYPANWDPMTDPRVPVWEALHQLIRVYKTGGERGAGVMLAVVKDKTESIRQLAYRLYTLCERRGLAEDARGYNELVTGWASVESAAETAPRPPAQLKLFGDS